MEKTLGQEYEEQQTKLKQENRDGKLMVYKFDLSDWGEEHYVATTKSLKDTLKWYRKEICGIHTKDVKEVDPSKIYTLYAVELPDNVELLPLNEARHGTYHLVDGEVCEYISILEACNRDANINSPYVVCSRMY